jgi:transcription factor-like protein/Zn(2)-Cys(6) binuclear cluster domain-containing protein/C2H2 type zinc finger protein
MSESNGFPGIPSASPQQAGSTRSRAKAHACPECRRIFSRLSHLDRHRLTHLPAANRNLVPCPRCSRTFARRDVMLRHLRATHRVVHSATRSHQRSCSRCVAKKIKCDRSSPCGACQASSASCDFPNPPALESLDDEDCEQSDGEGPGADDVTWAEEGREEQVSNETLPQALRTPESASAETIFPGLPMETSSLGYQDPSTSIFSTGEGAMSMYADDSLSPSYLALMQPELRSHGFDWLGFDMPELYVDPPQQWPPRNSGIPMNPPAERQYPSTAPEQDGQLPRHQALGALYPEPTATSRSSPALRPFEPQQGAHAWPFDQTHDAAPRQYKLPPLKDVLQSNNLATHLPGGTRLDDFVQLLSDQRLPPLGSIQRAGVRQAFGEVQRLLDLYFDRFHDIQAIVHKPTWNMAACPSVLLAAMACIGALLSGDRRDTELSSSLSDLCMSMINWLVGLRLCCA